MHPFTLIFLALLFTSVVTRIWLSRRQINHILSHKDKVPEAFAEKISLTEHQKAADYSTTKLKLGRYSLAWETLWLLTWTLGGGLSLVDYWWQGF